VHYCEEDKKATRSAKRSFLLLTEERNEKEKPPTLGALFAEKNRERTLLNTGGTAARWVIADDTGESKAPEVKAEPMMVIFP